MDPGFVAAQAAHCVAGATVEWSLPVEHTIVLLDADHRPGFEWLDIYFYYDWDHLYSWEEPDWDNQVMAIAIRPGHHRKNITCYPLLFKRLILKGGEINGNCS